MVKTTYQVAKGRRTQSRTELKAYTKQDVFRGDPAEAARRLRGESDRGAIILVGSMVELTLEALLSQKMLGDGKPQHKDIFGADAAIGTFARKALIAQALGLISPIERELIDHIRAVRNEAAHSMHPIDFEQPAIRQVTLALLSDLSRAEVSRGGREHFRDAFIIGVLVLQQRLVHRLEPPVPDQLAHVVGPAHTLIDECGVIAAWEVATEAW